MRGEIQTHDRDGLIAALAERQHGVVARAQLLEIGVRSGAIDRAVQAGRLHLIHRGVYAVGHRVLSLRGRWMAAVLASRPGAVLSHHSAAALWGIRSNSSGPIHITSPSKSRSRGAIRRHFALLPPDEVMVHDGIPVTTAARTIFDLAADSPHAVEPALRQSEYLRLYGSLSLVDLLARYPGHRGNRAVEAALARRGETSGHTIGAFEDRFLLFLDRHRLPRPQFNAWLVLGPRRYQVDCLWPDLRQIAELDSWSAHGTRSAFRDDKARDRQLHAAGYTVTRIAWSQLDDEPGAIAADLRALLGQPKA